MNVEPIGNSTSVQNQPKPSVNFHHFLSHFVMRKTGDYAVAKQYMLEGLTWLRQGGPRGELAIALGQVADVAYLQGDYAQARSFYDEGLALFSALGDVAHVAHLSIGLGYVAVQKVELEEAAAPAILNLRQNRHFIAIGTGNAWTVFTSPPT